MHAHMALGPNRWLGGEEQKPILNEHAGFLNSQQRNPKKVSILTQTDPVNRLPDADQSNNYNPTCLNSDNRIKNEPTMFDPNSNLQPTAQPPNSSVYSHVEKKDCDNKNNVVNEFPFCYNMNVLQKVQQQQTQQQPPPPGPQDQQTNASATPTNVVTGGAGVGMDDKTCYRFDMPQPFTYNYALVNQMSLAAAASTATFKCEVCGAHFSHISMLNNHKRVHANNIVQTADRAFSCDTCGSCFNDNADLKAHKTSIHKVRFCATCSTEINCEQIKNKKAKYVRCENCLANSSVTTNFAGTQSSPVTTDAQNSAENNLPPSQNNLSTQQQQQQQQQNNTTNATPTIKEGHHPVKRRNLATIAKCHKCNGSGVIFIGVPRNLDKPFQCNICEGRFSRYSSLWSHKRLHTGDKPFKCQACGLTFAKAAYLKNHHRVHTGEKPFKCDVCGMQFSQSPHLKNHERIHSGERPYQCEVCEKSFARHSTLWNHKRIHTGEKPYRCDICGSAFNQATHLKNHGKVHTGEKPHRCDICEVGFSDRFALKRHRNIHEKYARQQQQQQAQQQAQQQQQVPNQSAQQTATASQVPPQPPQQQQQQPPQSQHHQAQTQTQTTPMDEVYKYEVSGPIAFPGCSRPPDQK